MNQALRGDDAGRRGSSYLGGEFATGAACSDGCSFQFAVATPRMRETLSSEKNSAGDMTPAVTLTKSSMAS
jgi:hypothetical protein